MYILLTPFLLIALLLIAAGLFAFKKWKWGVGLLVAAFVFNAVFHCFALHPFNHREGSLKVMCLNVHSGGAGFDEKQIGELITAENPDIICVEEQAYSKAKYLDSLLRSDHPYGNECRLAGKWDGTVYYSRFPLTEVQNKSRQSGYLDEILHATAAVGTDSMDVILCHLASNNVIAGTITPAHVDSIKSKSDFVAYLKNINAVSRLRKDQATFIRDRVLNPDRPTLILGDMNDIWGSGALRVLRKSGFHDAWWHAGFGYGATIHHPLPFRIDHILYSPGLKLRTVKRVRTHGLSDHDAVVATFDLE